MEEVTWNKVKKLGTISFRKGSWTLELNLVSWNGYKPKIDLREWSPDGKTAGKGLTLTHEEAERLYEMLGRVLPEERLGGEDDVS